MSSKKPEQHISAMVAGVVLQVAGSVLLKSAEPMPNWGLAALILGTGLLIRSCGDFCAARGRTRWLGLLGALSFIGLIVILTLPERRLSPRTPEE